MSTDHDPFACLRGSASEGPFVIAQLGQTLDGRIATVTGESRYINGDCALEHLHRLRAAVDAVVVGIGTVVADDPLLTVRRASGPNPARVVIDPRGRVPVDSKCLAGCDARRIVIGCGVRPTLPEGVEFWPLQAGRDGIAPADIVAALAQAGLRRILVEGGAGTISRFMDAGCLDRLHVLVAPMILGSGRPGLDLAPKPRLDAAHRPRTGVVVFPDGDVLFDCDLRS